MLDKTNYNIIRGDLTPEEINALVIVREKLAASKAKGFDMRCCSSCIGHFVGVEMGMSKAEAAGWTHQFSSKGKFQQLFFPSYSGRPYSTMSQTDAAGAITNFLHGDEHPWGYCLK